MIEIKNIVKDYPVGDMIVHALKNVSINFRDNEFVSILGPSGCGKTTLLNIIGGLDQYTSGDIVIDNVSTKDYKDKDWDAYRNHYIGFVFQSYNLISHLSILENVELALSIAGISKKEKREKALNALTKVGLKDQIKKKPNQLSGGQMQRVAIARAIVNDPKIILADEPTGALDSETSVQVMDILKEISKSCLVVMVTHNGDIAEKYSDRIINILDGKITHDSNPYEIPESNMQTQEISERKPKFKSAMGFWTAFSLSLKNLISKRWKTILVSFAGSIGIIGIALILAVSNGMNAYVANMQSDALSGYPVTVGMIAIDYNNLTKNMSNINADDGEEIDSNTHLGLYDISKILESFGNFNYLNSEFVGYVNEYYANDKNKPTSSRDLVDVKFSYSTKMNVLTSYNGLIINIPSSSGMSITGTTNGNFNEGINNKDYVLQNYDLLGGSNAHYPTNKNEVALVIDSNNSSAIQSLAGLGIYLPTDATNVSFEDLIGKEYKLVLNDDYYVGANFAPIQFNTLQDYLQSSLKATPTQMQEYYNNSNNETLKITCVLRAKEDAISEILSTGIMYLPQLTQFLINDAKNSAVAEATRNVGLNDTLPIAYNIEIAEMANMGAMDMWSFDTLQKIIDKVSAEPYNLNLTREDALQLALQSIGASDTPTTISFYTTSFDAKQRIIDYIGEWNNKTTTTNNKIVYSDATAFLTSTLGTLIDIISYVLIAFSGISLVVSSIMIGIITYTSVIERTKEIGVLRSIGARKKDITRVFNSETLIIGFVSGLIGVLVSWGLTFPISAIIKSVAGGAITSSLAILTLPNAITLISISVILTLIAGLIPARMASKKDPVKALRTE